MRRIVLLIVSCAMAAAVAGCSASAEAVDYEQPPCGTVSVAHLKSLSAASSTIIKDDIAIEGYVVANDLYGEYVRSIVLCDSSGGIEIAVDTNSTATLFPVSAHVTVHCQSLALGNYGGTLVLGAQPTGEYVVDRIAETNFSRYFTVDVSHPSAPDPTVIKIENLAPQHIGNFVELCDVRFADSSASTTWCAKDSDTGDYITTEHLLTDRSGHSVAVRVVADCKYRGEILPSGYGTICGIVEYFNGSYSIRIVRHLILFDE